MTASAAACLMSLLRQSASGGPAGSGLVVRRVEHYAAVEAFAVALGAQISLIAQGQVNNAPLARRHGRKVEGRAGLANFLGRNAGGHAEFLHADGALVLAIKRNLLVLARRQTQNFKCEQFQRA